MHRYLHNNIMWVYCVVKTLRPATLNKFSHHIFRQCLRANAFHICFSIGEKKRKNCMTKYVYTHWIHQYLSFWYMVVHTHVTYTLTRIAKYEIFDKIAVNSISSNVDAHLGNIFENTRRKRTFRCTPQYPSMIDTFSTKVPRRRTTSRHNAAEMHIHNSVS